MEQPNTKDLIFGVVLPSVLFILNVLVNIITAKISKKWPFRLIAIILAVYIIIIAIIFPAFWVIAICAIAIIIAAIIILPSLLFRDVDESHPKVSLAKLPIRSPDFFGREGELKMLRKVWKDRQTNIVSLVAFGGMGKTALVGKWLEEMRKKKYRGAKRVYGWSFYSQGSGVDRQASSDQFIDRALAWFNDPDREKGSLWDKAERLAGFINKQRTLLILDGVEPLQYPLEEREHTGGLRDRGLQCLLRNLAIHNSGLCIITTRWAVEDFNEFVGKSVKRVDLEKLSTEAGVELLENLGVKGAADEIEKAVGEFGGHALALNLLGSLLKEQYDGDVRCRKEIDPLEEAKEEGGHAHRVMESYERYLGESPELNIMYLMGLFNRPAEKGALDALRKVPVIPGLTDRLFASDGKPLSDREWERAVGKLRHARLLLDADPNEPGTLDAHPLVREHFGEKLRKNNPKAWREAHSRLYEYYRSVPEKELPDTLDEMMPLYAAVAHGCQAGRYQEALMEVYYRRILRRDEHFSWRKLGSFGAELAAISGFFDTLWSKPVDGLTEDAKAFVLNAAGFRLKALGRLAEAAEPMQAALKAAIEQEDWVNKSRAASNLSELHLTMGEVVKSLGYIRQSMEYADQSGDALERKNKRAALADVLHQAGELKESEAAFREAEEIQKDSLPSYLLLHSLRGYQYCDLLLAQGKYREVLNRAGQTLKYKAEGWYGRLDVALDHLSLGRAHLLQAQKEKTGDFSQASAQLDQAVNDLRQAEAQDHLPRGLLARAELHRVMGNHDRAQRDLDEAMTIATRGGMRLHEADCHLAFARLHLAMGDRDKARESLAKAKKMIDEMGYHRRDGAVAELEEKAGKPEGQKAG